jgi:hypothetical protein
VSTFPRQLLLSVALLGCAHASAPAEAHPPPDEALVRIAAFDCEKHEGFPGEAPAHGPIRPGAGIRAWKAGGPQGANWNVMDLRCTARATAACSQGEVRFTLRVGQQVAAERRVPLVQGTADLEVVVPVASWERGYDSPAKDEDSRLPFRTAVFRVQAALACEAPERASLRDWSYRFVAADDAFVAGFASGE